MAGGRKRRREYDDEREQDYALAVWRRERRVEKLKAELRVVRQREEGKDSLLLLVAGTLGVVLLVLLADHLKAFVDALGKLVALSVLGAVWLAYLRKCVYFCPTFPTARALTTAPRRRYGV